MAELPKPHSATVDAIHRVYEANARVGHNDGIAISQAAEECDRRLWYGFRWAYPPERHEGRQLRLFQTGEREETRMLDDLRAIGCEVGGEQERVRACGEHVRGKLDGRATGIPEAPVAEHVVECKTHNDKSFKELLKKGVQAAKPAHFAQIQLYMELTGLTRGLYMAHAKNTDELYTERLHHDALFCAKLLARMQRIIDAPRPPAKLHDDPTSKMAWACKYCPAAKICHEGEWAERNCRTCLHSTPIDGGKWWCERNKVTLTRAEMQQGCPALAYIPDLVPAPWEQVDCDVERGTVLYRNTADGAEFVDGDAGEETTETGVVIVHPEYGVFLGHALRIPFWTIANPLPRPKATAFVHEIEAKSVVLQLVDRDIIAPAEYRFVDVEVFRADGALWATREACVAAGLPWVDGAADA